MLAFAMRSSFEGGTTMGIFDADGKLIFAFESPKAFASVVFSSPDVKSGKTYTVGYGGTINGTLQDGICKDGRHSSPSRRGRRI